MSTEKKYLRLKDVNMYISDKVGIDVCRATVYNWTTNGRITYDGRRIKLRTISKLPVRVTTEGWVDEFIREFQGA